ncbi:MAG: hypothetical protein WDN04_04610 [Rhodospirillales bacterium]
MAQDVLERVTAKHAAASLVGVLKLPNCRPSCRPARSSSQQ